MTNPVLSLAAASMLCLSLAAVPTPAMAQSGTTSGDLSPLLRWNTRVIRPGETVSGALTGSDVRRNDGSYADGYYYDAQAGERVTITMRSSAFDSWLVVDQPDGPFREHNDDGAGGQDARLNVTFPQAGRYLIVANSVGKGSTGAYTLSLVRSGGGGQSSGSGGGGDISSLAGRSLPFIRVGQTINGSLTAGDFKRTDDTYADAYFYDASAGERIVVTLRSNQFDTWLVVDEPAGPYRETNDDGAGGSDSKLVVTFPRAGRYLIVANSLSKNVTGNYSLSVGRP